MELDKIPGLKQAVAAAAAEEEQLRDTAFIEVTLDICGVEVAQLTARHLVILFAARSPFLFGTDIAPRDVAQFLWIVSPRFSKDGAARDAFIASVAAVPFEDALKSIDTYLDAAMMDRPSGGRGVDHRAAIVSTFAVIIDAIANAYGWDDEKILDKPISRLFQYLRLIHRRVDTKASFINPLSDAVRRRCVTEWMKKKKKRGKRK